MMPWFGRGFTGCADAAVEIISVAAALMLRTATILLLHGFIAVLLSLDNMIEASSHSLASRPTALNLRNFCAHSQRDSHVLNYLFQFCPP